MNHSTSELGPSAGPAPTTPIFSRLTSRTALVSALQAYLREVAQPQAMQLMWQGEGVMAAQFNDQPTPRMPSRLEWLALAAGQTVQEQSAVYVPMLVLNELRGWVVLEVGHVSPQAQEAIEQAGMALALMERQSQQAASRELALMHKIGNMLSTTLQLEQLLPNLALVVRELIVADDFYIALIDEETSELTFAYLSTQQGAIEPHERWSIDRGLTGEIIRTGALIVTDDYLAECTRRNIVPLKPHDVEYSHAWLGVPLCHHNRVVGVMVATIDRPNLRYSDTDVHLMSSVAAQAAAAVAHAQLYKQVQQQAVQLELINRIGRTISATLDPQEVPMLILRELTAALDVMASALLIEDPHSGDLVTRHTLDAQPELRTPQDNGLAREALRTGTVRIANDIQRSARHADLFDDGVAVRTSLMCAPLRGRERVRGVIQLYNKRGGKFTRADAQLLEAVAEQAGVALENAELYSHTDSALARHIVDLEQRNQQLTNIVSISNALRSTNDVRHVSEQIAATIQQMTGSQRIVVGLVESDRQLVRGVAQIGLDPTLTMARPEQWTPISMVRDMLRGAQQIGTVSYHLGQHKLAPGFGDCMLLTLLDANGSLVGIIAFDTVEATARLSSALLHELEIIANQAAITIVNARLASEQEQTVDRLTALNALSLAVTTAQLSTDEIMQMTVSGAVGTTNGLGGGWSLLGHDDGPRQRVIGLPAAVETDLGAMLPDSTDEYIELEGVQVPAALHAAGVLSISVVPVRGAKLTLGALWIGYSDLSLAPAEREMVVLYAKMAGAVLENLRLFDQVSAEHDRLASILASTTEGMLMATAQGRIAAANTALCRLLGMDDATLEGALVTNLFDRLPASTDQERFRPICDAIVNVASGDWAEREGEINIMAPVARDLAWSVLPVRGSNTTRSAALLVLRDVTAERQTEKLRQDLANMIVHDLRAPLTNMIVSNDLLLKQISGPLTPAQQRILEIAGNSSQQMLDLVNALLDIRRLEQRQLEIQHQPVELFEIVEAVFERLERIAIDRKVTLSNDTAPLPPISVDVDLVRRVVQNLVDNAIKFSPRGGQVRVSGWVPDAQSLPHGHSEGQWLVVDIMDEGKGVPESYRSIIFELFGQAPTGRGQGTGLGLAFCKLAVAAHGGMIWVEDGPQGGAVFRFSLPIV